MAEMYFLILLQLSDLVNEKSSYFFAFGREQNKSPVLENQVARFVLFVQIGRLTI